MIEDKLHPAEKEGFDLRKYAVSALLLLKNNRGRDNLYDATIKRDGCSATRALLSSSCRSKIKMIYYRLPATLKSDKA